MKGIIGKKVGMTSYFDEGGKSVVGTVVEAGPCVVTQVKTTDTDGYNALQIAFGEKKLKNTPKAMQKNFENAKTTPKKKLVEFRDFPEAKQLGDVIKVDIFKEGETIDVCGTSIGKGFQGVVKRHNFSGVGSRTHGQHDRQRAPGSIGNSSFAARVMKGMRMAGRMGGKNSKVRNIKVLKVYPENNIIVVSGAVPGKKGAYLIIQN